MALLDHDGLDVLRQPRQRWHDRPIPANDAGIRPGNDNRPGRPEPTPELDCLVGSLCPSVLRDAAARARALGTGADRVLIASGAISEADYLFCFARHTGIAIESFDDLAPSDACLLPNDRIHRAAQSGLMPFRRGDNLVFVIAPRHLAARNMTRAIAGDQGLAAHLRVATASNLESFLLHGNNRTIAQAAANGLRDKSPSLSAAPRALTDRRGTSINRWAASVALAGMLTLPPDFPVDVWSQMLALWFIAAIGLRLSAACLPQRRGLALPRLPDADLPVYSVIVALYREARCVPQLLGALDALDYPREKLDLIVAVEADDPETRAAIAHFRPMPNLRVIVAPDAGPRTKPKALNCALPFARGSFIAVFDAEDRPYPGQLRAALDAFRQSGDDVACVQASLCIHNVADSLFTRMFAAEYAGQFDAVLPGLAAMDLPLPLGGSSNHFRTEALRALGAWDAWNVTEDADLGLRLARFGYRAVTFASTTLEEAPITFLPWLRQRSRWMKGWMQTWSVHMRDPRRLWRDCGWRGFATLNLVIGVNIVSALAYPVFLAALAIEAARDSRWLLDGLLMPVHLTAIASGLVATAVIGLIGLARRGRLRDGWILLLTPIYWGCLSIATWRALWQLLRDPYRWEKTEHGLTRRRMPRIMIRSPRLARQR